MLRPRLASVRPMGRSKRSVPINRPIKRSGPKKETLERKAAEDERAAVVVSDLELQPGAKVPEGVQLEPLLSEPDGAEREAQARVHARLH